MLYFILWCLVFVISILIELMSPGYFFFLSFSFGALSAAIISLISDNLILQIYAFIVVSIVSFIVLKQFLKIESKKTQFQSNIYALIGKEAIVISPITLKQKGTVKVNGEIWTAKAIDNEPIDIGSTVEIVKIRGTHVIVKKLNNFI